MVVPLIIEKFSPASVVDVGCGPGAWLSVFAEAGVECLGIDGASILPALQIPRERFVPMDLSHLEDDGRRFDAALCLEVAEHLSENCGEGLVQFLCHKAPIVLFSAAIPGQIGDGHINAQWQEYWRKQFAACGHLAVDIRPELWGDDRVAYWYQQNMLLYVRDDLVSRDYVPPRCLNVVHPSTVNLGGREAFRMLWRAALRRASRSSWAVR